ncbi:hypothetical protein G6514_009922 [Epicoccum nigrum]|nr:hypothetical protein G6514_009922 [Epicoccum nigrum]
MNEYGYRPLRKEVHEMRLLQIQKSSDESAPITIALQHASLDDRQPVYASSYTWGDETPTTQIAIRDGAHQGFVPVRRNLFEFLKEARQSNEAWTLKWFWIDQISINQRDQDERGHQVGLMRKVYSNTQATLIWPLSWSESSFEAVKTLSAENQVDPSELICDKPERRAIVEDYQTIWKYPEPEDNDTRDALLNVLTYGLYMQVFGSPDWK